MSRLSTLALPIVSAVSVVSLVSAALAFAAPPARADVDANVSVQIGPLPLPSFPSWIFDVAHLPLATTVPSVLEGLTYEVCASPSATVAPTCSLPTPLNVPVAVDVDRARPRGLLGALGALSPDVTATLSLSLGDADSSAAVLGLDLDPSDLLDGVSLRFEIKRNALDALDGVSRPGGRVFARLHIPVASYDATLGFEAFTRLADRASIALGIRGEDLPATQGGRFQAEYVLEHVSGTSAPLTDHAVLIGLTRVARPSAAELLAGAHAVRHDPLALRLRFSTAPARMTGALVAEQTPDRERIDLSYALAGADRPGLELLATQTFDSVPRLLPDVSARTLFATLDRIPGSGRLFVEHTKPLVAGRERERVAVHLDTQEAVPHLAFSELLTVTPPPGSSDVAGSDRLDVTLDGLHALSCGHVDATPLGAVDPTIAACAHITALVPRELAAARFDPDVAFDLGVAPTGTRLGLVLASDRGAAHAHLGAAASDLPTHGTLAADVDLVAPSGDVAWHADSAATDLALTLDTAGLAAQLDLVDIPANVTLDVGDGAVSLLSDGTLGRISGWLTTTGVVPMATAGQHLRGDVALSPTRADVALALRVSGIDTLLVTTGECFDGSDAHACVALHTPGDAPLVLGSGAPDAATRLDVDLAGVVDGVPIEARGALSRLPGNTHIALRDDALDLTVDGPVGLGLVASIGGRSLVGWTVPPANAIRAEVSPSTLRAALALNELPRTLHVDLDAIRGLRSLTSPSTIFPDDASTPWSPPLAGQPPLARLGQLPQLGPIALDVTLQRSNGVRDVAIDGVLDVQAAATRLDVGPVGLQPIGFHTRALEAHLSHLGGALAVPTLTVAIATASPGDDDVVQAELDHLPASLALLVAVGGNEIQVAGRAPIAGQGVALLLQHSVELKPALTVRYRNDTIAATLPTPRDWLIDAALTNVPQSVWLVSGGGKPGDSGNGCIGIAIPTPTLEYAASEGGLGLDAQLEGALASPNLAGTLLGATIGALPHDASIAILDGANLLSVTGHGEDIDDVDITVDADINLRLDCHAEASADPIEVSAGIRLEGAGGGSSARLGVGVIGLHLGSVRSLEVDFGDLRKLLNIGFSFDRFPLSISFRELNLSLRVAGYVHATFITPSGFPNLHFDIDPTFDIDGGLQFVGYTSSGHTPVASFREKGCGFDAGFDIARTSDLDDADLVLIMPHLAGVDTRVLTGVAAVIGYFEGAFDGGDLGYLDGPDCDD